MSEAKLIILSEDKRGTSFPLLKEEVTIGRATNADFCIQDPTISGHHCTVIQTGDGWSVRDEGSTNGTRVNGDDVEGEQIVPLNQGDMLQVGSVELLFDDGSERLPDTHGAKVINLEETVVVDSPMRSMENLGSRTKAKKSDSLRDNGAQKGVFILILVLLAIGVISALVYLFLQMNKG